MSLFRRGLARACCVAEGAAATDIALSRDMSLRRGVLSVSGEHKDNLGAALLPGRSYLTGRALLGSEAEGAAAGDVAARGVS